MAYHADAETFQRDRTKQNRALAAGWRTVRFTWEDVVNDPGTVLTVR
jgi:very-short-patch-repair endonuclease